MKGGHLVRAEVREVRFGFFSEEEVRALSVCRITSPVATDTLGNSLSGGLYDPRLGPRDQMAPHCTTCGMPYISCPGHCGHIELGVPVYHPLVFPSLFSLLRAKCMLCHRLRVSETRTRLFLAKMKLLEMGDAVAAQTLDGFAAASPLKEEEGDAVARAKDLQDLLRRIDERFADHLATAKAAAGSRVKSLQRELTSEFIKSASAAKKCESCGGSSPKLRKDGFVKIYQRPLSKRDRIALKSRRVRIKSAMETIAGEGKEEGEVSSEEEQAEEASESESDSEDGEGGSRPRKGRDAADKYLAPVEVEAQMRLLWEQNGDALNFIWARAFTTTAPRTEIKSDTWRLFFLRTVLVPPSRFRPPSVVAGMLTEHPQNLQLTAILQAHEKISEVRSSSQEGDLDVSGLMTHWVSLQNAVNGLIDADKQQGKKSSSTSSGIRQLLERKEGLFRRHMMGKRVNFCCRSVISPDPYLGSNEIGIPKTFAMTLHLPVPVTPWNVKTLREMVERGPEVYPGEFDWDPSILLNGKHTNVIPMKVNMHHRQNRSVRLRSADSSVRIAVGGVAVD